MPITIPLRLQTPPGAVIVKQIDILPASDSEPIALARERDELT
jgi:hypothetical protein